VFFVWSPLSAYNRSWEGDHSLYTGAFLKRHSSLWRLTDRGREQAETAGAWLREHTKTVHAAGLPTYQPSPSASAHSPTPIHRHYVSEYIRAMETAALMELPDAKWSAGGGTHGQQREGRKCD
jgi:NAD+ kinase